MRPGSSCAGASVRVTSPVREEERRGEEEGGRGAHKVLLRLRQERGRGEEKVGRREKNRTWGQATLQKGRERGAVKDLDYTPNYENVYGGEEEDEGIGRGRSASGKRSRELYRSKSCDRAGVRGTVRDQVEALACLSSAPVLLHLQPSCFHLHQPCHLHQPSCPLHPPPCPPQPLPAGAGLVLPSLQPGWGAGGQGGMCHSYSLHTTGAGLCGGDCG